MHNSFEEREEEKKKTFHAENKIIVILRSRFNRMNNIFIVIVRY